MKVRYFAWMKRTVGIAEEEVTPPAEVRTVGDLVAWLRARGGGHAEALAEGAAFGAAVDKRTATEYKLLLTLVERRGRVQSRPQLLEIVWEAQPDIQTRTVDMHVQRLRTKLEDAGKLIETVRGFGYRFRGGERGTRSK